MKKEQNNMKINEMAAQLESYMIDRRRFYHSYPELSGQEENTINAIAEDLESMGVTVKRLENCHGLIGTIHGGNPGKTFALRADIDGLAITEKTGVSFASKNQGVMHACGHDAHIAMLLGAAKILCMIKETLPGNVRLIIQPDEERALGAKLMIAAGALDGVDAVVGMHIWGNFDSPLIDVSEGRRMAANDQFRITINGKSAHGGAPNLGVDSVVTAAAVVMNLQTIVSRNHDPINPFVITIGSLSAGTFYNVIADSAILEGTVRHFATSQWAETAIRRVVSDTCAAYGASCSIDYHQNTLPIINKNEQLNRIAHDTVIQLYGESALGHLETMMSSEDFCWYMEKVPALFGFIGSRCPEKGLTGTNHQEIFTIDESVLQRGAAVMAQIALDFLKESR